MLIAWMRYDPVVTLVKVLLAEGSDTALERADHVLGSYLDFSEQGHMNPSIVRYSGLQALLLATRGDDERAAEALTRAVRISQPGGAVRLLADLGAGLVPLLSRLEVQGSQLAHVAAILAAIGGVGGESSAADDGEVGGPIDIGTGQVLTQRESDVLRLLALRYSNKEIAARAVDLGGHRQEAHRQPVSEAARRQPPRGSRQSHCARLLDRVTRLRVGSDGGMRTAMGGS